MEQFVTTQIWILFCVFIVAINPFKYELGCFIEPSVANLFSVYSPVLYPVSSVQLPIVIYIRACENHGISGALKNLRWGMQIDEFFLKFIQIAVTDSVAIVVRSTVDREWTEHAGVRESHSTRHEAARAETGGMNFVQVEFVAVQTTWKLRPQVNEHFVIRAFCPIVQIVVAFYSDYLRFKWGLFILPGIFVSQYAQSPPSWLSPRADAEGANTA